MGLWGSVTFRHNLVLVATSSKSLTSRFHHGSSMGRIFLRFGHTTPRTLLRPLGRRYPCETWLWVAAVILLGMRVSPKPPRAWKEDLSLCGSRNLALTGQVLLGPVRPQGRSGSQLPLIALPRSLPGNATSESKLDLGHGHRRLVGVSVNRHT